MDNRVENFFKLGVSGTTGTFLSFFVEPYIRGEHALNWIPDVMRNTTNDALFGFIIASGFASSLVLAPLVLKEDKNDSLTWSQILITSVALSILFCTAIEVAQGVAQFLHITDQGFAWIDLLASQTGALGLPLLDFSAKKLSQIKVK